MTWEEAVLWLRTKPEHAALVRDCYYDDPLLAAAERYHASPEWAALRQLLPGTRGRVLDVGAGRGIASYAFARDGWDTVALEPDGSSLVGVAAIRTLAADAGLRIDVRQGRGESLPFGPASFDVVFGRAVMHHARDVDRFCAEVARVLRPGGTFIGAREHVISRSVDLPAFLRSHPLHRLCGGEHAYREREYRAAIARARLRLERALNPWASDVNLAPSDTVTLRRDLATRLRLPSPALLPPRVLSLLGRWSDVPGRLYTFVARKPHA